MRKIIFYIAVLATVFAFSTSVKADTEITAIYKVSADKLWDLVQFHKPSENIMPPIESSKLTGNGVGAIKLNNLKGGGELVLQLVYFSPKSKSYNYVIRTSPLPLKNYVGQVRVEGLGKNRSKLIWSGVFEPKGVEKAKADEIVSGFYKSIIGRIGEKYSKE